MWLYQAILKLLGFVSAYLKNLHYARFDLLGKIGMTKSQLGRFYWVNLVLCAFVLYRLFDTTQQLRADSSFQAVVENVKCRPEQPVPVLAFFILAEVASFILLVGAHAEAWILYRLKKGTPDHPIFAEIPSRAAAARRLHRLLWTWFPLTLGIAVYLSKDCLNSVVKWCDSLSGGHYSGALHGAKLILALVFPGLLVSFFGIAALNWAFYRWSPHRDLVMTLGLAFAFYILAIAIVGPTDLFGLIKLSREIRIDFDSVLKLLVGT
jgi:hypothetical protein